MAITDRPVVKRLLETAEERTGLTLQRTSTLQRFRVMEQEYGELASDAEELALHSLDYFGGRPQELRPEKRRRLAQRSRIALLQDPLAGAEAQLLSDFAFGKGIGKPTARDPRVQAKIDGAWTDPINEQLLTGYQAQRKLSNELLTQGELMPTLYVAGGSVRVGRLDPDDVVNIVPDPENAAIPLWFVARERKSEWDFETDSPKFADVMANGQMKVKYWAHWRNVDVAIQDRDTWGEAEDEEPLEQPPPEKLAKGKVYHVAINQVGGQLRGNPPWARSLRFMNAMNVLTEAHVTMAQAASTFVAKRAMKGSRNQITRAAASVLSSAGELGASAFRPQGAGVGGNAEPTSQAFTGPGAPAPFPPGSWWNENMDSEKLDAFNLKSNAGEMSQTAQIVRAPIAATSGFGQHYLGDTSDTNLATASTLELPATMHVGAWQEHFEQLYRWFTDRALEAAVQAGLLGGSIPSPGDRPLGELCLAEAVDKAEMERRTGADLSYEFSMPFPGRRQLADVVTVVQQVSATMDPNGVNIPLRRLLLKFLFEQIGVDDVAHAVEECIPEKGMPGGIGPQATTGNAPGGFAPPAPGGAPAPGAGSTSSKAGAGANDPAGGGQPYGAKSGTGDGALEAWVPLLSLEALGASKGAAAKLFEDLVREPAARSALELIAGNGHNGG